MTNADGFFYKLVLPGSTIVRPGRTNLTPGITNFITPVSLPRTHPGTHMFIWSEAYDHSHRPDTFLEHWNNSNDI